MQKRSSLYNLVLILLIASSFIFYFRAICEDDDVSFDLLCRNNDIFQYDSLVYDAASRKTATYESKENISILEPFISYIARYEKSPPQEFPA